MGNDKKVLLNDNYDSRSDNLVCSYEMQRKIIKIMQTEKRFSSFFDEHGINSVVVYGVGFFGKILIEELWKQGIQVVCGIDKKVLYYKNLSIKNLNDEIPSCDAIIVSPMNYANIVNELKSRTDIPIYVFADILDEIDYRINCNEKMRQKNYLEYLVLNILDHCNLRCKGCDHFACLAEPYFVSFDFIRKDLKRMQELFAGENIMQIAVMGGEPLLHPDLLLILKEVRTCFPHAVIRLTTNGLLLLKQVDDFWKVCREERVTIVNTKYPINLDYSKIQEKAKKEGVEFRYFEGTGEGIVKKSFKKIINLSGDSDINDSFLKCHISNYGNFLMEGKLYGCPFSCQSYRIFNKKFGTDLKLTNKDYLNIYEVESSKEIFEFVSKPRPYCGYCEGITKGFDWSRSQKEISEWTEG